MPSISDARDAIREQVATLLRCYDVYPEQPQPPCAVVGLPSTYEPNDSMSDTATMTIPVLLYVPYQSNRTAEALMQRYLATSGDDSVLALIEAAGENYGVTTVRDFDVVATGQGQPAMMVCTIEVVVYA